MSALAGTVIGGLISYYTNQGLQDRQFERDDRLRLQQAQAAATIEFQRFVSAGRILDTIQKQRTYLRFDRLTNELSVADREVLLIQMPRSGIEDYSDATDCVDDLRIRLAKGREGEPAPISLVIIVPHVLRCVLAGKQAVAPLVRQ